MIDYQTLKIYLKYKGDTDVLGRFGAYKEQASIVDEDWLKIDGIVRGLYLVNKNLASPDMEKKVLENLYQEIENDSLKVLLQNIAKKWEKDLVPLKPWWKF